MSAGAYTLLVNTCDAFEDCWGPFFTLLAKYWPQPRPSIFLNTELKSWQFTGVDLTAAQVQFAIGQRPTWSQGLRAVLDRIDTPVVLYMQEDYFIERDVEVERIESLVRLMTEHPEVCHIGLTHFGSKPPFAPSFDSRLWTIGPRAGYRVSTQAGLWRTATLKSYLQPWENGWMFEVYGTVRAWRRNELFLTVRRDEGGPVLAYQHTGIVKGQWSRFVPALFQAEGISMDFDVRGFHDDRASAWLGRAKVLKLIASRPLDSLRSLMST